MSRQSKHGSRVSIWAVSSRNAERSQRPRQADRRGCGQPLVLLIFERCDSNGYSADLIDSTKRLQDGDRLAKRQERIAHNFQHSPSWPTPSGPAMASRPWHTLKSLGRGIRAVSNVPILWIGRAESRTYRAPLRFLGIDKRGRSVCSVEAASPCQKSITQGRQLAGRDVAVWRVSSVPLPRS